MCWRGIKLGASKQSGFLFFWVKVINILNSNKKINYFSFGEIKEKQYF